MKEDTQAADNPSYAPGWEKRLLKAFAWIGFGFALAWSGLIQCPTARLLHTPCPGCGLTRASRLLFTGHIVEALRFHPLVIIVTPLLGTIFVGSSITYVRHGVWGSWPSLRKPWATAAALLLGLAQIGLWISRFYGAFGGPVPVD